MRKLDQKFLFCWEIWKLKSTCKTRSQLSFSWPLHFCCLIKKFTFLLTKKKIELQKKTKVKARKNNWEREQIFLKKKTKKSSRTIYKSSVPGANLGLTSLYDRTNSFSERSQNTIKTLFFQKGVFRHFLEKFYQKLRFFLGPRSPSK